MGYLLISVLVLVPVAALLGLAAIGAIKRRRPVSPLGKPSRRWTSFQALDNTGLYVVQGLRRRIIRHDGRYIFDRHQAERISRRCNTGRATFSPQAGPYWTIDPGSKDDAGKTLFPTRLTLHHATGGTAYTIALDSRELETHITYGMPEPMRAAPDAGLSVTMRGKALCEFLDDLMQIARREGIRTP